MHETSDNAAQQLVNNVSARIEVLEDAHNLDALIEVCRDLKKKLVPRGANPDNWDSAIATLDRCKTLRSALASSRADTERLDWLESLDKCVERWVITPRDAPYLSFLEWGDYSLRAAIDKARAAVPSSDERTIP